MKKLLLIALTSFILFSCKKDSFRGIEGGWRDVAHYRQQPNGSFEWLTNNGYWHLFYSFSSEGKFATFTDVPEGSGSYSYDGGSRTLVLKYEANANGGAANSVKYMVEQLGNDRLVLAEYASSGELYSKTEFERND